MTASPAEDEDEDEEDEEDEEEYEEDEDEEEEEEEEHESSGETASFLSDRSIVMDICEALAEATKGCQASARPSRYVM